MANFKLRRAFWRTWNFLVHEDSLASFAADAVLILLIGKFILFPGLGLVFGSEFPVVAVVSGSMDHQGAELEDWWAQNSAYYENQGISFEQFENFYLKNGFEKGDVLVIRGTLADGLEIGDIIVYSAPDRRDPIIHRIISTEPVSTKGDANFGQISFERDIAEEQIHGKAILLIPYIGWVKVGAMELLGMI